jgi:hypothetical protein
MNDAPRRRSGVSESAYLFGAILDLIQVSNLDLMIALTLG